VHFPERIFSVNTRQKRNTTHWVVFLFWSGQVCFANLSCGGIKKQGETGDAPPAAEEANPFRGSGAICGV